MNVGRISPNKSAITAGQIGSVQKKSQPSTQTKIAKAEAKPVKLEVARTDLLSLAEQFNSGKLDKNEANRRFIDIVLNNSLTKNIGKKDYDSLVSFVEDFFQHDPDFMHKLIKNLRALH